MIQAQKYNGGLTSEQFLFYEIRIAVKFYLDGKSVDEAVSLIKQDKHSFSPVRSCHLP